MKRAGLSPKTKLMVSKAIIKTLKLFSEQSVTGIFFYIRENKLVANRNLYIGPHMITWLLTRMNMLGIVERRQEKYTGMWRLIGTPEDISRFYSYIGEL